MVLVVPQEVGNAILIIYGALALFIATRDPFGRLATRADGAIQGFVNMAANLTTKLRLGKEKAEHIRNLPIRDWTRSPLRLFHHMCNILLGLSGVICIIIGISSLAGLSLRFP